MAFWGALESAYSLPLSQHVMMLLVVVILVVMTLLVLLRGVPGARKDIQASVVMCSGK